MSQDGPHSFIRRHFFFVAGYDPMDVVGHHRIFARESARFAGTWQARTWSEGELHETPTGAYWDAGAAGPGWESATRFELLAWNDIVKADMARSRWSHILGSARAMWDMVATGTVIRYFRFSRRYGIFFALTYVMLLAMTGLGIGAGLVAYDFAAPLGPLAALPAAVAAGLAVFFGLMATLGARVKLKQSLDLAEFSVDFVRGRHGAIDARLEAFADRLIAVARNGGVDEIVVAGHSLGAMHVVSLVALALRKDPDFARAVPVRLLTVGSTAAKFALHPAGGRLREAARTVHDATSLDWIEFQAKDDIVSFYKVDPVSLTHAGNGDGSRRPFIRQVTIRGMMTPGTYARYRLDIMRLHCQFFLANDCRAPYDFYAFIHAPISCSDLVAQMEGPMAIFAPDGSLIPGAHLRRL
ncbi:hypothetical protein J5J86_02320 [Aquabacter sp. L1I39]|uniref:hypothetical protein n=1 Tax=Aquabacter sp. L1I39 TaxID=2820278 RepID=UPI001ADC7359|nr:hypothetical protein [Aquabacter sp. L1I39]QTL04213.1 hypothetical protein J5J86_02320 [Aquabacter sp. L1I39]